LWGFLRYDGDHHHYNNSNYANRELLGPGDLRSSVGWCAAAYRGVGPALFGWNKWQRLGTDFAAHARSGD